MPPGYGHGAGDPPLPFTLPESVPPTPATGRRNHSGGGAGGIFFPLAPLWLLAAILPPQPPYDFHMKEYVLSLEEAYTVTTTQQEPTVEHTGMTLSRQMLKFFFWFGFSFFRATLVSPMNSLWPNLSSSHTEILRGIRHR